jgi:hypothetical protein
VTNKLSTPIEPVLRLLPASALALGACSLAWNEFGSIYARDWLPYAVAAALLPAGLLLSGVAERPSRAALLSTGLLVALAGWDALSLIWSPVPQLARDEALLVLLYAVAFLTPSLSVRNESQRRSAAGIATGLVAALAVAAFVGLLVAGQPTDDFENGRLTFPISYVNAGAAVLLVAFWPAIALASDRTLRAPVRGAALAGSTALLSGWLMTQSKGGLVALVVSGLVFFAVRPGRLAGIVPALVPAALVAASYSPLTRPFRERLDPTFADAIRSAAWTALALTLAAGLIGLAYAALDRRVSIPSRANRTIGIALLAVIGAAIVGSLAAFFVVVERPGHYLDVKWRHFKTLPGHERGSSHLASLGSNRYDFWRVELGLARDHPLAGIGARGFAQEYLAKRRSTETPARGHSLELDVLSETGVVGLVLVLGGLGGPLLVAFRRARRTPVAAGLAAAGTYAVVHASVDWVWTFPAFGVLAFGLLGIAAAGNGGGTTPIRGAPAVIGGVAALAVAVGAFGLPWISSRLTSYASTHPASAASDLRWARRLDPLAVDPWLAQASLSGTAGGAAAALEHAVGMQPRASGLRYLLGRAYLRAGNVRAARRELQIAHRLDPHDPEIADALRAAHARG